MTQLRRDILILNDVHIGVNRVAGATPVTAMALRQRVLEEFKRTLMAHLDKDVAINGDIFDAYDIAMGDAFALYIICCEWLERSIMAALIAPAVFPAAPGLAFIRGNHDVSKDSSRLSMFDFVTGLLKNRYPERVQVVTEPDSVFCDHVFVIPHMVNQELFNLALEGAKDLTQPCYILLHANFDNQFTVQSDHSLNVSREQAKALTEKGHVLIFGHEHQQREPMPGVVVAGNQFPTSIADCLNNAGDVKRAVVIDIAKPVAVDSLYEIETWKVASSYIEIDWRDIAKGELVGAGFEFIRVIGAAASGEAAAVISAVSKLRQKSPAYVVANAVKIEGIGDMAEITQAVEEMKEVDVLEYLCGELEPEQAKVVRELLAGEEVE